MNYTIRNIKASDYSILKSWWEAKGEICPSLGLLPKSSTFILELNNTPIMSMGLFLTNCELAYVENYIASPNCDGSLRDKASVLLANYVIHFAKELGYNRLYCSTQHPKLVDKYKILGMQNVLAGVYSLSMEI